jgi:amino acid transporter
MAPASDIINRIVDLIVNPIILVVFAFGFFMFMVGLVRFLWNLREGEASEEGKNHMLWGIVGMLVMISVWGIISLVTSTFGIDNNTATDTSNISSFGSGGTFH